MKHLNRRWETFSGIIVGVTIIAIVIGSIAKIFSLQYQIEDEYLREEAISILRNNSHNIAKKLDTSNLIENESFSIYQDRSQRKFLIMTGASVADYRFVDAYGKRIERVDQFPYPYFSRLFYLDVSSSAPVQNQIIRVEILPFNHFN